MERGKSYTFLIEGGNDSDDLSNYHPLYITDSVGGGRQQNTPEERAVNVMLKMLFINDFLSFF